LERNLDELHAEEATTQFSQAKRRITGREGRTNMIEKGNKRAGGDRGPEGNNMKKKKCNKEQADLGPTTGRNRQTKRLRECDETMEKEETEDGKKGLGTTQWGPKGGGVDKNSKLMGKETQQQHHRGQLNKKQILRQSATA